MLVKYKIKFLKLLMCFLVLLTMAFPAFSRNDMYHAGIVFYKQGKYKEALKYFSGSIKANPTNVSAIYYFANTLVKTHNLNYAKKYYEKVIELSPDSKLAGYSRKALEEITSNLSQINTPMARSVFKGNEIISSKNSYINDIPNASKASIWNRYKMPLKVYMSSSNWPEHRQIAWEAFQAWQSESENFVAFEKNESLKNSDIQIHWLDSAKNISDKDYGGYVVPEISENQIKSCKIYLNEFDKQKKNVTPSELYSYTMHQIGHCLGITVHSDSPSDLMSSEGGQSKLTRRDKNTLMLLYGIDDNKNGPEKPLENESTNNQK